MLMNGKSYLIPILLLIDFISIGYRYSQLCWLSPGASCSKLTTSLVNVSLKFQTLILQIHAQKCCTAKDSHIFSTKNNSVFVTLADICGTNLCLNDIVALQRILTFFQQKITVYLLL